MYADVPPPPVVPIGSWGAGGGGVKNSKNWGFSFVHRTATVSISISDAKCSPICRAQTCAHSGAEPSRSAKAYLQGGPKSMDKAYGKKLYLSAIQLSHVFGSIGHGVLQGEAKSE